MMVECANCGNTNLRQVIDLGNMPLANALLTEAELPYAEPFYPLKVVACPICSLMQLERRVAPEKLFADYAYFSSYSKAFLEQNRQHANALIERLGLTANSLVVEIGSNDGYMLRNFVERGIPALGIEPAPNVAKVAMANGIPTEIAFFNEQFAHQLCGEHGSADLIIANNVLAHIPDIHGVAAGIQRLLALHGTATIEVPNAEHLINGGQFDTIYHEHVYYFSFAAIRNVLQKHDLDIVEFQELSNHGGSLRLYVKHRVQPKRDWPHRLCYTSFEKHAKATRRQLRNFLIVRGKTTVGFGAPAKATILLNYCGLGTQAIPYLVDDTPYKQGRFVPGTRTPIYPVEMLRQTKPAFIMIIAWNHEAEIREKLVYTAEWGAQIILPYDPTGETDG